MTNVVIVESPAKAKTINKYLGKDFEVFASFGHVRDLPAKDGSVKPDQNFEMTYVTDADAKKNLSTIAKAVKSADHLYLATDPDREGEAISWHVLEALKESKAIKPNLDVKRIVFTEITKKAVLDAVANPRDIDMNLVNAQQARRALDYLVGFTLSPVLWRKLPGSRSAGRVQSVALRLICERDAEIEAFVSQEYWDISANLLTAGNQNIKTRLTHWNGEKLEKFSITKGEEAEKIAAALRQKQYVAASVEPKQARRHPAAPFTTSTLQQEAARKLGFGAKKTMMLAQKLYEGVNVGGETTGLITYMRTDGVTVSGEAIAATRDLIGKDYGQNYLPSSPRQYKVKTSNAQEAHEAIRPTDVCRTPAQMQRVLDNDMHRLYELIWKRMVASQMESAILDQVVIDFEATDKQAILRANGSVIKFDGFLKLYQEGKDEDDGDDEERRLPSVNVGEQMKVNEVTPEQHFTEPPPRYTEASLVKKLEELGIGRPSTYASIISVLQDRDYVRLDKKRFVAEPRGRIVSAFLVSFFEKYVEYGFTGALESKLDEVAEGEYDWKQLLRDFWSEFIIRINESKKLTTTEVLDALDKTLEAFVFKREPSTGTNPRTCPTCGTGRLSLKTGKFGAFIGCSNYPDCNYTKQLTTTTDAAEKEQENLEASSTSPLPRVLGKDPKTGEDIHLKKGPYGVYVQLGEEKKPKRASLPRGVSPDDVTLEMALSLLALPREIGHHPETGKMITAGIGRFGPYLLHDGKYTSIPADDDVLTIGINRAVTVIAEKKAGGKGGSTVTPLRVLGKHPDDGKDVAIYKGRYGAYAKHGKVNATLPKGADLDTFTLEEALPLLAAKAESGPKKKPTRKKAAPKKAKKEDEPKYKIEE